MKDAVRDAAGAARRIDVLINNAGIALPLTDIVDTTASHFETHQRVNAWGVINGMKAAREFMGRGGAIVNTSSILGVIGTPGYASYSTSKHAVIAATKIAALEFGGAGIRVNAVAPIIGDTPKSSSIVPCSMRSPRQRRASPLGCGESRVWRATASLCITEFSPRGARSPFFSSMRMSQTPTSASIVASTTSCWASTGISETLVLTPIASTPPKQCRTSSMHSPCSHTSTVDWMALL